jgi:putative DNA primase/helicase
VSSEDIRRALKNGQDGDACLFTQLHRDRFIFDHAAQQWHEWTGHSWREDRLQEVLTALDAVTNLYAQEAERTARMRLQAAIGDPPAEKAAASLEKALLRRIRKLQNLQRKRSILTLAAAGKRGLSADGAAWDSNPWLLGCPNGVIDLRGEVSDLGVSLISLRPSAPRCGRVKTFPGQHGFDSCPIFSTVMNRSSPTFKGFSATL